MLLVTLMDSGEVTVEPREVGVRDYDELEIDMTDVQDGTKLKAKIRVGAGRDLVRKVILKGLREAELMADTEDLEAELGQEFFHLRVEDRSHPRAGQVSEDTERLIRNRFIRLMNERIESAEGEGKEIAESALQYGIALLDGREVL